ncbi:MAG: bifunctional folylpolyglutamate synthase/dihydrofolate synthase, partial [Bacteroidetes bacterium]
MNYAQTLEYLYARLPMFQRVGPPAFKKDLSNTRALLEALGHPERKFRAVHIAGTNGKGSVSHMLAALYTARGFRVGLYTSPHFRDFRERVRIGRALIPEGAVVEFVERLRPHIERIRPSFFEITVALAFDHFAREAVDLAVVETGLGGRLDSTNVLRPLLSVITNIGFDHQQFLGDTLPQIAAEKAGIIKPGV